MTRIYWIVLVISLVLMMWTIKKSRTTAVKIADAPLVTIDGVTLPPIAKEEVQPELIPVPPPTPQTPEIPVATPAVPTPAAPTPSTPAAAATPVPVPCTGQDCPVGRRCGPELKTKCGPGLWCSAAGYCGTTAAHRYPTTFGAYNGSDLSTSYCKGQDCPTTTSSRCGPVFELKCPDGKWCSAAGYCGITDAHKTPDTFNAFSGAEIRGRFDDAGYLRVNPDVAASAKYSVNPWLHFTNYGKSENRPIAIGDGRSGRFDPAGYLRIHPDVAASGIDAWTHYISLGHTENRDIVLVAV